MLTGLLVVGPVVVASGVSRPRLDNCNCSLSFVAGVVGSIPCCFRSKASKAAGFVSVDGDAVVEMLA